MSSALSSDRSTLARWAACLAIPLACLVWVVRDVGRYYFVFDEWVLVNRVVEGQWWEEMFVGFNGHLTIINYWIYHLQVNLFGTQTSTLVYLAFCASLLALHLCVAAYLWRAGLHPALALLAAAVVTYFGRGAETMVFQFGLFWNVGLALVAAAGFVALGDRADRKTALTVAALLALAVGSDSGFGAIGVVFVGPIVALLWPRRLAVMALAPPFVLWLTWTALDASEAFVTRACTGHALGNCLNPRFSAPFGPSLEFATNLGLRAAGGLIGGFERAGVVALVIAAGCTALLVARRQLPRRALAGLIGGILAAGATAVSIAYSRAGFWETIDEAIASIGGPSNRYIQPIALFLMLGVAPVVATALRAADARHVRSYGFAAGGALVIAFTLNLSSVGPTQVFYERWSESIEGEVRQAVGVIAAGCGAGTQLDRQAQPIAQGPQVTAGLLQDLLNRGALSAGFGRPAPLEMSRVICIDAPP